VKETSFKVGETVFVFHPPGLIEEGGKLVPPWMGPYVVTEKVSEVAYLVEDRSGLTSRVHVNRLTRLEPGVEETQDPQAGTFPDSRRLLRKLMSYDAEGKRFKVRSKGRNGYIWTEESNLPDIIVTAYKLDHQDCLPAAERAALAKRMGTVARNKPAGSNVVS
jgi:hypothetical protein